MKFQWRGGLPYISWCARKDGWERDGGGERGLIIVVMMVMLIMIISVIILTLFCPAYLSISRNPPPPDIFWFGGVWVPILFGNDLC